MGRFDNYLSILGKPFSEVPQEIVDGTRERLLKMQSDQFDSIDYLVVDDCGLEVGTLVSCLFLEDTQYRYKRLQNAFFWGLAYLSPFLSLSLVKF